MDSRGGVRCSALPVLHHISTERADAVKKDDTADRNGKPGGPKAQEHGAMVFGKTHAGKSTLRGEDLHLATRAVEAQGETSAVGETEEKGFAPLWRASADLGTLPEGITQAMAARHDDRLPIGLMQFEGGGDGGCAMTECPSLCHTVGDVGLERQRLPTEIGAAEGTADVAPRKMLLTQGGGKRLDSLTTGGGKEGGGNETLARGPHIEGIERERRVAKFL